MTRPVPARPAHLVRRFFGSLSTAEPTEADLAWARSQLMPQEFDHWRAMTVQDRRHSIIVAHRFAQAAPATGRAALAGALLHDVGKQAARLGTFGRVAATLLGPRTDRLRRYHDHEALGAALLARTGSEPGTVDLVAGRGPWVDALRAADDV